MKKIIAMLLTLCLMAETGLSALAEEGTGTGTMMTGGWQITTDATVTDEVKALLDKAFDGIDGSAIEPIALLGTQLVAGTNYCILSRISPVVQDPVPYYVLIYIYADLSGGAQLLQIQELDPAAMMEDDNG